MTTVNSSQAAPALKTTETSYEKISREELTMIFHKVGRYHGFENAIASFAPMRDFKVQWSRSCDDVEFKIPDYLDDAPEDVLRGLAEDLFKRIFCNKGPGFCKELRNHVLDPSFHVRKKPAYLRRSRTLKCDPVGEHRDLRDSVRRLEERGFIDSALGVDVVWDSRKTETAGSSSVLMRVVSVNKRMDEPHITDDMADYVVYCLYLRIREGIKAFGTPEIENVRTRPMERLYPGWEDIEKGMRMFGLFI